MRVRIVPGSELRGSVRVPGDKSIAHRWLILAATAHGRSELRDLPASLDVRATAAALSSLTVNARPALYAWVVNGAGREEGHRSTWNPQVEGHVIEAIGASLEVEGDGRSGLVAPTEPLDCANSATSMRLLMGVAASASFESTLTGDESLRRRPMERVAEPLRAMGASVSTMEGHAPVVIEGAPLEGRTIEPEVASAQIKGAVLLAGVDADGVTEVREAAATRDHTERALRALGAPIELADRRVSVRRFQHEGFAASVPGDPSSAAFLVAAAALTRSEIVVMGVGLNPSRTRFLEVMERMGIHTERRLTHEELGEPVGDLAVRATSQLAPVRVGVEELPLLIDEVPVLALLAAHASGESRFLGGGELRVKESDRLDGVVEGVRALGGDAAVEGDDLVLGGGGIRGGTASSRGDHRMAMAFAVSALGARGPVDVDGIESADVSFPGFLPTLMSLGASVEPLAAS